VASTDACLSKAKTAEAAEAVEAVEVARNRNSLAYSCFPFCFHLAARTSFMAKEAFMPACCSYAWAEE